MKNAFVIGDKIEAQCFDQYCDRNGISVEYYLPTSSEVQAAERDDTLTLPQEVLLRISAHDSLFCFADDLQITTDVVRKNLFGSARDLTTLRHIVDKNAVQSNPKLSRHLPRAIDLGTSRKLDHACLAGLTFPLVFKPSNAFYSAGVGRCDSPDQAELCFQAARKVAKVMASRRGTGTVIAQEYIDGQEFAVDGFVSGGQIFPLLMHHKYPDLIGPLFHEYSVISRHLMKCDEADKPFRQFALDVIADSGLDNSPFHMEFRRDAQGAFRLLEIAPRLSGGSSTGYTTGYITAGIDMFALLDACQNGQLDGNAIAFSRDAVSLEIDFSTGVSGTVNNVAEVTEICRQHGSKFIYTFKKDGDFVRAEGAAMGSCLLSYFSLPDWESAENLFRVFYGSINLTVE